MADGDRGMTEEGARKERHLHRLALLYGVQTAYYDNTHHRKQVSSETLLAVLRALGAPVETLGDVPAALQECDRERLRRCCEPIVVAWEGGPPEIELRLPKPLADARAECRLLLENGEAREFPYDLSRSAPSQVVEADRASFIVKKMALPGRLPWGYHRLIVELKGETAETLVISAPREAYTPFEGKAGKTWGIFLPLYALHSRRSFGCGDLTDLEKLMEWVAGLGGSMVGTLPLLSAFLDEPFIPSPYSPASRLFWNEIYLDVSRLPELAKCPSAQAILSSSEFQEELRELRASSLVDYRRVMAVKRKVLEELALSFFAVANSRQEAFRQFLSEHPALEDYVLFRAAGEKKRSPWPAWPKPLQDGVVTPDDYDEKNLRYHLYVQWAFHEQIQAISDRSRRNGKGLFLDMPLGASYDSYDVWRHRDLFAMGVSAGAPPDDFFIKGQDWGFPPMHPVRIREEGHRYFRACLRQQFRHAGMVRIDHIMGLHRSFWVPRGMEARDGTYVRYPADDFYSVLALESHRCKAQIVGEDLGTVSPDVRPAMARHNFKRTFVVQVSLSPDHVKPLGTIPAKSLGCINTHDMPTFASFWRGQDIKYRGSLGLLGDKGSIAEKATRHEVKNAFAAFLRRLGWLRESGTETEPVLVACLSCLSASSADAVIVNLEDLWGETNPQNVPGTWKERPNWMRKAMYSFEAFSEMPWLTDTLQMMNRLRKRGKAGGRKS